MTHGPAPVASVEARDDSSIDVAAPLLALALFLVALSLRPQLVGIAPLIPELQQDLGMSHAAAGLLGTIPVLCMGILAPAAPFVAARFGTTISIAGSVALIGGLGLVRAFAPDALVLVILTVGVGIGMGVAGTLLPVVVKERLASRPVAGTASYSAGLQFGAAVAAALAVPLATALGDWREALAVFSICTLVLLVPWLGIVGRGQTHIPRFTLDRRDFLDRVGWVLAGVFALFGIVYYGLISWLADAYVELGWSPAEAGGLIGLLNAAALVGALTVGIYAGRRVPYGACLVGLGIAFAAATAGLTLAPAGAPLFALAAGYANGALFPLILALPLRLLGSPARVAAVSAVMLGAGYTVAALSPVVLGAVRDATGSFQASLLLVSIVAVAFAVALVAAARVRSGQASDRPR